MTHRRCVVRRFLLTLEKYNVCGSVVVQKKERDSERTNEDEDAIVRSFGVVCCVSYWSEIIFIERLGDWNCCRHRYRYRYISVVRCYRVDE